MSSRIPYVSLDPPEPPSVTSIRKTCGPAPSIVALPKMLAAVREAWQQGAGYGHMMCYAEDSTGAFARYRWSVNAWGWSVY